MDIILMINFDFYCIPLPTYYLPILVVECEPFNIRLVMLNHIIMFMNHPRTNIDSLSACFEFYFMENPSTSQELSGQVISRCMVNYTTRVYDYIPCILYTRGFLLTQILIYLPIRKTIFLRELLFSTYPVLTGSCTTCMEDGIKIINVHRDRNYVHGLCKECLLRVGQRCPVCRERF